MAKLASLSMDELYEAEDYALIKRRCHKAKPSLSYIGAIQTRKILESIEADLENSQEQFKHLLHDIEIIEKELGVVKG